MSVTKLESGADGSLICPVCDGTLIYKDGGQVRVVDGRVDYENIKPRYVCFKCRKFYREMLHSGFYDVFDFDEELEKEAREMAQPAEKSEPAVEEDRPVVNLTRAGNSFSCPTCGKVLVCAEGSAIQVVNGKVDYESIKNRYICEDCGVYYKELLNSGMYERFRLEPKGKKTKEEPPKPKNNDVNPVVPLQKNSSGHYKCPVCDKELEFSDGGQVRIVDGKVDYENVKARYICRHCETFYRELLNSGLYEVFNLEELELSPEKKRVIGTGDLEPMQLKQDANGQCACPRCGANMKFLEPEAVKIVNGRADMRDTVARFACDACSSIYRRIATTDYYQWSED